MEKCSKIEEMIKNGSIESDLANETNEEISKHLTECAQCRALIEDIRKISLKIRNAEKIKVSGGFDHALKIKLEAAKREKNSEETKTVPFFTRMVYYAAGVAAVMIGFMYVSSSNIFDGNNGNNIISSPVTMSVASASADEKTKSVSTDSLENLRENVVNDEELRLKVNAGE